MSYETPAVHEIGNVDELTLGGVATNNVDAEGLPAKVDNQF